MRCDGSEEQTICWYSQSACDRSCLADTATVERVVLYPGETNCSGSTLTGEWRAVLFSSAEDCRKAAAGPGDFDIDKAPGYYGSKLIVKCKSR